MVLIQLFFACLLSADWSITADLGLAVNEPLQDLVEYSAPPMDDLFILGLSANHSWKLDQETSALEFEFEVIQHLAKWGLIQLNPLLVFRLYPLPWDRFVESSFAIGNGLSYLTGVSEAELIQSPTTAKWLYAILLEFTFELSNRLDLALRVHHRSGIFGLVEDANAGSNFLALGIKYGL